MTPIKFKESHVVMGQGQIHVEPLHAFRSPGGEVISCWKPSWKDKLRILLGKPIWLHIETYNSPLQPSYIQTEYPFGER